MRIIYIVFAAIIFIPVLSGQKEIDARILSREIDIVINSEVDIDIEKRDRIQLLKQGSGYEDLVAYYDDHSTVNNIRATIYDHLGNEIRSFKKKDAYDLSMYDGFTIASDSRYKYLELQHLRYPYTRETERSFNHKTLFHLNSENIQEYGEKVDYFKYTIDNAMDANIQYHIVNCDDCNIEQKTEGSVTTFIFRDLEPIFKESHGPSSMSILPRIDVVVRQFVYDNYQGSLTSWEEFGKFCHQLNHDSRQVPEALAQKLDKITEGKSTTEKIHAVYSYLQDEMRYVSIQLGIGGWQSYSCAYVEENKFGDCKALSNFMLTCLQYLGIESHYTVINATSYPDYPDDYFLNRFNHVVLHVPETDEWYECTSSSYPPGYLGSGNYGKEVLVIKDGKGVRSKTPIWDYKNNKELEKITINLLPDGSARMQAHLDYYGRPHEYWRYLEQNKTKIEDQITKFITSTSTKLDSYHIINYPEEPQSQISIAWHANHYASKSGSRLFVPVNAYLAYDHRLEQLDERTQPFIFRHGVVSDVNIEINIPEGYQVENVASSQKLDTEYGNIETTISADQQNVTYRRNLELIPGEYAPEKYDEIRNFYEQVYKLDSPMLVLVKKKT